MDGQRPTDGLVHGFNCGGVLSTTSYFCGVLCCVVLCWCLVCGVSGVCLFSVFLADLMT